MTNMKFKVFQSKEEFSLIKENYFVIKYQLESKTSLAEAAWNLAIGQSIGNPSARSEFETEDLFKDHSCIILGNEEDLKQVKEGSVEIAFPNANINFETDGVSQLLVQIMGGQCDIDNITKCIILEINLSEELLKSLKGPIIGLKEMKYICEAEDRPLFGGIVKPKVGMSPEGHFNIVKQLIDGGCDFIKEDEILSDPSHCPINKRVPLVMDYIKSTGKKIFYCVSISADQDEVINRVKQVYELGGNGVHINFHCGLGIYKAIRKLNLPLVVHFQKSGDKLINCTDHRFSIDQSVIFKLVGLSGCSTLHAGMIGGYSTTDDTVMKNIVNMLAGINCVPALSCGMHPGLVSFVKEKLGHNNWMANVGGALTSHPMGTLAGTLAMKQAITGLHGEEYYEAIKKWGLKQ